MSFLSIFHRRKKVETESEKKLNILIYTNTKYDGISGTAALSLKKYGNTVAVNTVEEYFARLKEKNYDIVILYRPENLEIRDNKGKVVSNKIKEMVNIVKEMDEKNIVIACAQHIMASNFIERRADYYGVDYYFVTDSERFIGHNGLPLRGNFLDLEYLQILVKKIINSTEFSQDEKELVIQKKEFYESVKDIFDVRSTLTADTDKELEFLDSMFKKFKRKRILDVGCGKGRLTLPLAEKGFEMTGIDITESLLNEANTIKEVYISHQKIDADNPKYLIMNAFDLKFDNGSFDAAILMWHVICDLGNRDSIFYEMHKVLNNNGIIIFDFPNKMTNIQIKKDGTYMDVGAGLLKYRGMVPEIEDMLKLVELKGFQVVEYHRVNWGIDKYVLVAKKISRF